MPFIQIIEYRTDRIDELNAALDGWLEATKGKRAASRRVQTKDRDDTNTYVQIIEFPSYDDAMANSKLPETSDFAVKLASLCEGPPTFRNLDVLREESIYAGRTTAAVKSVVGRSQGRVHRLPTGRDDSAGDDKVGDALLSTGACLLSAHGARLD